ncbi:unnamed protein product [Nesidiocoris tenuis]|uniref:Uncharacterized protein n=1 Tax=Nesidiocoris tenuis TaxID=355587 RepID=A0A6H5GRD1_9HEMI|nr:unnamed protein product [Nesidiocoris tenuis]
MFETVQNYPTYRNGQLSQLLGLSYYLCFESLFFLKNQCSLGTLSGYIRLAMLAPLQNIPELDKGRSEPYQMVQDPAERRLTEKPNTVFGSKVVPSSCRVDEALPLSSPATGPSRPPTNQPPGNAGDGEPRSAVARCKPRLWGWKGQNGPPAGNSRVSLTQVRRLSRPSFWTDDLFLVSSKCRIRKS